MAARSSDDDLPRCAVVVPIRSFTRAKGRLAGALDIDARRALVHDLAARALDAAAGHAVVVVTSDPEVAEFAEHRSVAAIADPGSLDRAAAAGREWARTHDCERVAILHADLPFVTDVDALVAPGRGAVAILVPDHRGDGTPALSVPVDAPFVFAYGPGSFARHRAHAAAAGLEARVVHDAALGFDIDLPSDLAAFQRDVVDRTATATNPLAQERGPRP